MAELRKWVAPLVAANPTLAPLIAHNLHTRRRPLRRMYRGIKKALSVHRNKLPAALASSDIAMSVRYGVSLLTDPDFTARAYRARQLICGQFACWAAEMHMLHMLMSDYFPFAGADDADAENRLAGELEQLAERYRRVSPRFPLFNRGISTTRDTDDDGNIWLDFSPEVVNESLYRLQSMVADLLERNSGVGGPRRVFNPDFRAPDTAAVPRQPAGLRLRQRPRVRSLRYRRTEGVADYAGLAPDADALRVECRRRRLVWRAVGRRPPVARDRQLQLVMLGVTGPSASVVGAATLTGRRIRYANAGRNIQQSSRLSRGYGASR